MSIVRDSDGGIWYRNNTTTGAWFPAGQLRTVFFTMAFIKSPWRAHEVSRNSVNLLNDTQGRKKRCPSSWKKKTVIPTKSRDSSVGIATRLRPDDRSSRVRFPAGAGKFSLHHRVQRAQPASYTMGTWESSDQGVKLTTHLHLVPRPRMRGAIPPLPNTSSWRST
jgi:hypothetical protein